MAENDSHDPEAERAQAAIDKLAKIFPEHYVKECLDLALGDTVRGVEIFQYCTGVYNALNVSIGDLELALRKRVPEVASAAYRTPDWLLDATIVGRDAARLAKGAQGLARKKAIDPSAATPSVESVVEELPFSHWSRLISDRNARFWEIAGHKVFNASATDHALRREIHDDLNMLGNIRNHVTHRKHVLEQDLSKVYDTTLRLAERVSPESVELIKYRSRFPEVHPVERLSLGRPLPEGVRTKVLQLACAVTDRIGSSYPFEPASMCTVIQEMLVSANDREDVPQDEVTKRAKDISCSRAESDCRAETARKVSQQASPSGTSLLDHELKARYRNADVFYRADQRKVYRAGLEAALTRLDGAVVTPSFLEVAVAKMAVCERRDAEALERGGDPDRQPERERAWERVKVTEILERALSGGSVPEADATVRERETLSSALQKPWDGLSAREMQHLQQRFYRSFTTFELDCLCKNTGPFIWAMPDEKSRSHTLKNLKTLHQSSPAAAAPWRTLHRKNSYSFPSKETASRMRGMSAER